jgi:hypothetical protein
MAVMACLVSCLTWLLSYLACLVSCLESGASEPRRFVELVRGCDGW